MTVLKREPASIQRSGFELHPGALSLRVRYFLSLVLGAVSVLSLPPFFVWPVLFATLTGLLIILNSVLDETRIFQKDAQFGVNFSGLLKSGMVGWCFGFGYFVAGLYWMGHAFLVESEKFALLLPLAVVAMPAFLALFYMAAMLPAAFTRDYMPARFIALATGIGIAEWLKGNILTGFPWNAIGYSLTASDAMMQTSSLVGLYGQNFLAVLLFASPALFLAGISFQKNRTGLIMCGVILILFSALFVWGHLRLTQSRTEFKQDVLLRIVQPNIEQRRKMNPRFLSENFSKLLHISKGSESGKTLEKITHMIWPEVAVRALLTQDQDVLKVIADMLPEDVSLITGSLRVEQRPGVTPRVYNSLAAINDLGLVTAIYDKMHLVPFGEYLPLQPWLEAIGLEQLTRQRGGFAVGQGPRLMLVNGVPAFSTLICYEVVFPGEVTGNVGRPGWMLNVTNDAWFGDSTGPHQHFHQARVRAVEEGLPMVRVANTGISGIIDGYGRILKIMPFGVEGAFNHKLPTALDKTLYARNRNLFFPCFALLLTGLLILLNRIAAGPPE